MKRRLQRRSTKIGAFIHTVTLITTLPDIWSLAICVGQLSRFKRRSKMSHPTSSPLHILWTVWARIAKLYTHTHADMHCTCTVYDITNCFRSEAAAKYRRKCCLIRLQVEFLDKCLREDHQISHLCRDHRSQKPGGYNATNCFRSAAKCS